MGKVKKAFGAFLVPLLSVLLAFLIGGIIMAALGANPFLAVKFLFQGAFGSKAGIGTTLTKATPLIFTALCACFAYKCGVFNLGGEGQFLMGSIAAFLTCYFTGLTGFAGVLLALLAGAVAGGFWGMIPGVLKIGRGQNEMIISIMLNYVATLFMGVIYTSWIRDASVPQTPAIADEVHLPRIITGMRFTWGFVIAVAVGLILYYVLFWTSAGFRLRAVGCNLTASRFNGIPVKRFMLASFIVSGAIAGLGGGAERATASTAWRWPSSASCTRSRRWSSRCFSRCSASAPPPCRPLPACLPACPTSFRRLSSSSPSLAWR